MIDSRMNGDTSTLIRLRNSSIRHRMQVYRVQGVCGSAILVLLYYCTRVIVQEHRQINTDMKDAEQSVAEYSIQQS